MASIKGRGRLRRFQINPLDAGEAVARAQEFMEQVAAAGGRILNYGKLDDKNFISVLYTYDAPPKPKTA